MPDNMVVMNWSSFAAVNGIINETRKTGEAEDARSISFVDNYQYEHPRVGVLFTSMIDFDDEELLLELVND